jgi:hypothetical protein
MVTDRRLLWGLPGLSERAGSLNLDTVTSFQETTQGHRWAITLRHAPLDQLVHQPAHRLLWWEWGNTQGVESFSESTFRFSRRDTKVGTALLERLALEGVRGEPPIRIQTPPRRTETPVLLVGPRRVRFQRLYPVTRLVHHAKERLYHVSPYWRIRLPGWVLFSLSVGLVNPWLMPLGVILFEAAVIGIGQWSWRRGAWRRQAHLPRR